VTERAPSPIGSVSFIFCEVRTERNHKDTICVRERNICFQDLLRDAKSDKGSKRDNHGFAT
jgi:hypothetical protein